MNNYFSFFCALCAFVCFAFYLQRIELILEQHRAPGEAATECFHQHGVAALDASITHRLIEGERYRGRRGVAMPVHGHDHVVHGHVELAGRGGDNAVIGLMRHKPGDVALFEAVLLERLVHDAPEGVHRDLEHLVALHLHERLVALHLVVTLGNARWYREQFLVLAVGVQMRIDNAGLRVGTDHHGSGTVTEQHAGAAGGPVDNARQGLGPDHQRVLRAGAAHEFVCEIPRINTTLEDAYD